MALVTVTTDQDIVDFNDGLTSLREAIFATNLISGADEIRFDPSLTASGPVLLPLTLGELKITDDLTIAGPGADALRIDASFNAATPDGDRRVFNANDGSPVVITVSLSDMTLSGGNTVRGGGAVRSVESIYLHGLVVENNHAFRSGGGGVSIAVGGSAVASIVNCVFQNNSAAGTSAFGAGLVVSHSGEGDIFISQTQFLGNSTNGTGAPGAGLYAWHAGTGNLVITGSQLVGNRTRGTSAEGGGALVTHYGGGTLSITDNLIADNFADGTDARGAGVFATHQGDGDLEVLRNTFLHNSTDGTGEEGTGIFAWHFGDGDLSIIQNSFLNNSGSGDEGGGAYAFHRGSGDVTITGNQFSENQGGGVYARHSGVGRIEISQNHFSDNAASGDGGGASILHSGAGTVNVAANEFMGNTTSGTRAEGGGLAVSLAGSVTATVSENLLVGNSSVGTVSQGSGIYASVGAGTTLAIRKNNVTGNGVAPDIRDHAGIHAIVLSGGTVQIEHNTVANNHGGINVVSAGIAFVNDNVVTGNSSTGIALSTTMEGGMAHANRNVIANNHNQRAGGGILIRSFADSLITVADSVISGNTARWSGGGVHIDMFGGTIELSRLTINGNHIVDAAYARPGAGGGLSVSRLAGELSIDQATISGNSAEFYGGGVWVNNPVPPPPSPRDNAPVLVDPSTTDGIKIRRSTIVRNTADADANGSGSGGGVYVERGTVDLDHTIVAGNLDLTGVAHDLAGIVNSVRSLVGVGDHLLSPLADNGGLTLPDGSRLLTHALLPGSPAIDAGDPNAVAGEGGVPINDGRGAPFLRVYGGRIDIGAFEVQPALLWGDYNQDGIVDAGDYSVWRNTTGTSVAPGTGADGNSDGLIDMRDYHVWKANFGSTTDDLGQNEFAAAATFDELFLPHTLPEQTAGAFQPARTSGATHLTQPIANQLLKKQLPTGPDLQSKLQHDEALLAWLDVGTRKNTSMRRRLMTVDLDEPESDHTADRGLTPTVDQVFASVVNDLRRR